MSVSFKGDCEWAIADYPQLAIDAWGFDVVGQEYSGRSDKIDEFRALWEHDRTIRHSTYSYATFDKLDISPAVGISTARVTWRGVAGGVLPEPVIKTGTRNQTINCEYTASTVGTATGIRTTFEYLAPWKRVTWWSLGKKSALNRRVWPSLAFGLGPSYAEMKAGVLLLQTNGATATVRIRDFDVQQQRGFPVGFAHLGTFGAGLSNLIYTNAFTLLAQQVETGYEAEQVGSEIIQETATVEMRLLDANLSNSIPTT